MSPKYIGLLGAVFLAFPCSAAPRIIGKTADARCVEARQMAQAVFRSNSASLIWPLPKPVRRTTRIILSQSSEDISGGGGIAATKDFNVVSGGPTLPTVFWRRGGTRAWRMAVVDTPFNWEGDQYSLYLLPPGATTSKFFAQLSANSSSGAPNSLIDGWSIPLVLKNQRTGRDWIINRGEPYETLADWTVYGLAGPHLKILCRVSFNLPKGGGLELLPPVVGRFAKAADEALGPGKDEGTLQPTARIRLSVQKDWATAALRPWAATDKPYNSRSEINHGLNQWAAGNKKRSAVLSRLQRYQKAAELPLAAYYSARFGQTPAAARRLSHHILDHNLRDYFTFSKNGVS